MSTRKSTFKIEVFHRIGKEAILYMISEWPLMKSKKKYPELSVQFKQYYA